MLRPLILMGLYITYKTTNFGQLSAVQWFARLAQFAGAISSSFSTPSVDVKAPSTRIRIFLNPDIFCCGFKKVRVHT